MKYFIWLTCLTFLSCAGYSEGMLAQFDSNKAIDLGQVHRHCEMDDTAACLITGKLGPSLAGGLAITQGMAPTGRAVFAVLLDSTLPSVKWFIFDRENLSLRQISISKTYSQPDSLFRVEHAEVANLKPDVKYELLLTDARGRLLDHRNFQTFHSGPANLRFAIVSGSDDQFRAEQETQWADVAQQNPNLIFAIGDNVYANVKSGRPVEPFAGPPILWERYVETRSTLAIFRNPTLIPIFSIWDDHDFGMTDGNQSYPYIDESRATLEAFFPMRADAKMILEGPGISRALKVAGQAFILMDNRSFRAPNSAPTVCRKQPRHSLCRNQKWSEQLDGSHFGRIQEDWALGLLQKHNGPVWLISGDQWFGDYHPFESFEGNHPKNFREFTNKLDASIRLAAESGAYPSVLFVSGDRHLSETMKVKPLSRFTYQTYEFTSSGIHANTFANAWRDFPNRRKIAGESGAMNYSIFTTAVQADGLLQLEMQARGLGGEALYSHNFKLKPVIKPRKPKRR